MKNIFNTIIIGAGAAGLMCASKLNTKTLLLEKNEKAGKKLFITGKGRCNLTNMCDEEEFINNVVSNKKFMYSAIYNFSSKDTYAYFENNGCSLTVERGNRVFPKSMKSYDVTECLLKIIAKKDVTIKYNSVVYDIKKEDDLFIVSSDNDTYYSNNLVIATGGLSYPSTGSTGDGYKFAHIFNHTIIDTVPALVGIKIKEKIDKKMIGFTLRNVSLNVKVNKKTLSEFGELAFYDNYLDGAIAITISSLINRANKISDLWIDFKPALSNEQLINRIDRDKTKCKSVYDLIKGLLPTEIIDFFGRIGHIDLNKKIIDLTEEDIDLIVNKLKNFNLTYDSLMGYNRSIITSGGVNTREIDPSTMESKIMPNLYFIGEVVDVDCFTGGFNIQSAFSMAVLASDNINEKDDNK